MDDAQKPGEDFASAFETAFARLQVALLEACRAESKWPAQVAAGVRAGLGFAAADATAAGVLVNRSLAEGPEGVSRHERLVSYLAARLLPGRKERPDGERLPEVVERAAAGGVVALVAMRLDQGREDELVALVPEAVQFVLAPYLGAAEAERVAAETRALDPDRP